MTSPNIVDKIKQELTNNGWKLGHNCKHTYYSPHLPIGIYFTYTGKIKIVHSVNKDNISTSIFIITLDDVTLDENNKVLILDKYLAIKYGD